MVRVGIEEDGMQQLNFDGQTADDVICLNLRRRTGVMGIVEQCAVAADGSYWRGEWPACGLHQADNEP